ncbi:MAG: hypothetical protein FWF44_08895, partial [Defluviitaleaceae bacterium]|nr:hypothetical protein [Defluviitaleaceae bacterium]
MRGKKIGVLLFFFLVIYLPLAVNLLRIHTNTVLTGVAQGSDYKRPSFSYASFLSGAYQKQFDDWYNNNFGMRTDVIKLYNQFRYSVFSQASSVVVGKEKELYENTYISYHYVTDPKYDYSKEYMDKLINDLSALQQIMDDNNKEFMVLITPSKTTFYPGDIPSSYQQEAIPGGENYYPEFAQALGSSGINYTDCVELMKDNP